MGKIFSVPSQDPEILLTHFFSLLVEDLMNTVDPQALQVIFVPPMVVKFFTSPLLSSRIPTLCRPVARLSDSFCETPLLCGRNGWTSLAISRSFCGCGCVYSSVCGCGRWCLVIQKQKIARRTYKDENILQWCLKVIHRAATCEHENAALYSSFIIIQLFKKVRGVILTLFTFSLCAVMSRT